MIGVHHGVEQVVTLREIVAAGEREHRAVAKRDRGQRLASRQQRAGVKRVLAPARQAGDCLDRALELHAPDLAKRVVPGPQLDERRLVAHHLDHHVRPSGGARRGDAVGAIEHHETPLRARGGQCGDDRRVADHGLLLDAPGERLHALRVVALMRPQMLDRDEAQIGEQELEVGARGHGEGDGRRMRA